MATGRTTKLVGALAGATVLAASFGAGAEARIPDVEPGVAQPSFEAVSAVPDVFERAAARRSAKPLAKKAHSLDAATADAFERAVLRRMRS
jgi:hypothetical protein